jgi:hypothetical protein
LNLTNKPGVTYGIAHDGPEQWVMLDNTEGRRRKFRSGDTIGWAYPAVEVDEVKVAKTLEETIRDMKFDEELTEVQQNAIREMLIRNIDVFAENPSSPGTTIQTNHSIDVEGQLPMKQRPYQMSHTEQENVLKEVDSMLKNGII